MSIEEKVEHLKNAAGFIALFKGSTDGIDKVIADLLCEPYHTPQNNTTVNFKSNRRKTNSVTKKDK